MTAERYIFPHKHLLGIEPLDAKDITVLLDQARAFEEVCERPEIKIVYMSGYTDDAIDHHGTLEPGTHLITKPFSLTDLRRKVRQVLDGN